MTTLSDLTEEIVAFRDERDWEQFHTPQNLAVALSVEAAELLEHFQWKLDNDITHLVADDSHRQAILSEVADILIYALLFCHEIDAEPNDIVTRKLQINADRYPADLARGTPKKYNQLQDDHQDDESF